MKHDENEYVSEDDEDYIPEKGDDDEDVDEGSGEDEAPLDPRDVISDGGRGTRRRGGKKKEKPKKVETVNEEDCTADFLDDLFPTFSYTPNVPTLKTTANETKEEKEDKNVNFASTSTKTTTITEVFDFAGDEVKIERQVTEEELKKHEDKEKKLQDKVRPVKRSGLGDMLTELTKKKKISTIDKSMLDWNSFKTENDLGEELKTFNKGKGGYLKRMEFLQEADARQFEQEKEVRHSRKL
ncbi:unnamed protein product, partial [Mesorhabditis belari]|uniref:Craniofacial development protein 1 n=1 Tax=Mesorhabditis belari TaxID=2138241 RepID=A0AAF3FRU3_9BILA